MIELSSNSFFGFLKKVILYGAFFLTLAFSVLVLFYGADFTDSPYHINIIRGDFLQSAMVFFSYWIGRCWSDVFGDTLLSFRVLNLVCYLVGYLSVISILIYKYPIKKIVIYVTASMIMFNCTSHNVFGYDGAANVFTVLLVVILIQYVDSQKKKFLAGAGVVTAFLVASRLPSITAVPVAMAAILTNCWFANEKKGLWKKCFLELLLYAGSFVVFFLTLTGYFYRTPLAYVSALQQHLITFHQYGYHSTISLVLAYVFDSINCFNYICVIFSIWYFFAKIKLPRYLVLPAVFIVILSYMILSVRIGVPYNRTLCLFISSAAYFWIGSVIVVTNETKTKLAFALILMASLIPALGSNTGFLKTSNILLPLLPFLGLRKNFVDRSRNDYVYVVLACVLVFSLANKPRSFYEDSRGLFKNNVMITSGKMKYIRTTVPRYNYLKDVTHDIEFARSLQCPVLLYGGRAFVFYYLLDMNPLFNKNPLFCVDINDEKKVDYIRLLMDEKKPVIFITDRYPEVPMGIEEFAPSTLDSMIKAQKYSMKQGRGYRVWIPPGLSLNELHAGTP